jgi:anti-sigma B factor antagonist
VTDDPITVTARGAVRIAAPRGEIDLVSVARMTPAINEAIRSPARVVIIDLTEVTIIDSSGLALVLNALRRLEHAERRLLIVCPEGPVRRTLELAGISGRLELFETRRDAVDAVGESAI